MLYPLPPYPPRCKALHPLQLQLVFPAPYSRRTDMCTTPWRTAVAGTAGAFLLYCRARRVELYRVSRGQQQRNRVVRPSRRRADLLGRCSRTNRLAVEGSLEGSIARLEVHNREPWSALKLLSGCSNGHSVIQSKGKSAPQHSTAQFHTVQYTTRQGNTMQYSTVQYNTRRDNTIQYNTP